MVKIDTIFCNNNTKRELISDLVSFKNKKITFSLISYLFLFCFSGTLFLLVEFDTKYHFNMINIIWADTVNGTENADNITGTIIKDLIKGLSGNDTISGLGGGDDISGGSGNDIIYGNEGRDVLKGKAGNDRIDGGEGNDRIIGNRGNDMLIGGPGNDTLTGGLGKDIFICGTATDTITDFNLTQKDTTPENDCENQINEDSNSVIPMNINKITDNKSNNVETAEENKKDGFFLGLFK